MIWWYGGCYVNLKDMRADSSPGREVVECVLVSKMEYSREEDFARQLTYQLRLERFQERP